MKLEQLLSQYSNSAFIDQIADAINQHKTSRIKGMSGSFDAIVASSVFLKQGGTHLFILHDKEEAAYFLDDMSNFLEREKLHFFPRSEYSIDRVINKWCINLR